MGAPKAEATPAAAPQATKSGGTNARRRGHGKCSEFVSNRRDRDRKRDSFEWTTRQPLEPLDEPLDERLELTPFLAIVSEIGKLGKTGVHSPKLGPSLTDPRRDHAPAVHHRPLLSHGQSRRHAEGDPDHFANQGLESNDAGQIDPVQEALDFRNARSSRDGLDVDEQGGHEGEDGLVEQEGQKGRVPKVEPVLVERRRRSVR